jgi:hypothetical protein
MSKVVAETVAALLQQKQNQNKGYFCQHQTAAIAITQSKDIDSVYKYEN